jgi:succinoglycan biosynthesis transport protein ExoP
MSGLTSIISRHWKPLTYLNLAVFLAIIGAFLLAQKTWTAKAQLILPETNDNLEANLGKLGSLKNDGAKFSDAVNPLLAQKRILTSDIVMEQVFNADPQKGKIKRLAKFKKLFDVAIEEQSTTIELNVEGKDRELARKRAQTWINVYNNRLNQLRKEDAENRSQFTNTELKQAQQKLNQSQITLSNFQRSSGLVNSDEQTKEMVRVLSELTTAKYKAESEAKAEENRVKALSTRLNLSPSQAMQSVGLGENKDYQAVREKLKKVELELTQLRATRTDLDPRVEELTIERDELRQQARNYAPQTNSAGEDSSVASNAPQGRANLIQQLVQAESTASAQRKQAEQLDLKIDQIKGNLKSIPGDRSRLLELQRQQEIDEGVYQGLVAQLQQAKINAFSAYPSVQVFEPPSVDPKPTSPKLELAALNLILCSLIGSIALLMRLESRNPLLDAKDLQLFNFPTVYTIRRFRNPDLLSNLELERGSEVEVDFQRLASAISLQPLESRRLLVTSSISGEGKTTVTIGLAKALGDLGFRVLLVDGDFRKAELSATLTIDRDRPAEGQVVQLLPNLDLLPTYPQQGNIIVKITQGKFENSIAAADARGNYDYILVDSAPVSLTSEAALMATIIPNVLFVVRPDYSERNSAYESIEQLKRLNAKIMGLIINGVIVHSKPYGYPYGAKYLQASKE